MKMTIINVGYGDALLLQSQGDTIMIDGGSALPGEFSGSTDRLRSVEYLLDQGIESIDTLIITHLHEDHVCGLEAVLEAMPVREIWIPYPPGLFRGRSKLAIGSDAPNSAYMFTLALNAFLRILDHAEAAGIPVRQITCADSALMPLRGLTCQTLAPSSTKLEAFLALLRNAFTERNLEAVTEHLIQLDRISNESSLLLLFRGDGVKILLGADSSSYNWSHVESAALKNVTVLKLPHHGQIDSLTPEAAELLNPEVVITTASSDRRYGSANPAIYEMLAKDRKPMFLFSDERAYPPYFNSPQGHQAIELTIESGTVKPEFIHKKNNKQMEETR